MLSDSVRFHDGRVIFRPITIQAWYPAKSGSGRPAPYIDNPGLLDSMAAQKYLELAAEDLQSWDALRVAATLNAPPAKPPRPSGWPVLVLSHGFGVARANYSALAQELASQGYVVVSIDHPYGGFTLAPDGRVLQPGGDSLRRRLGSDSAPASVDSALAWDARAWSREAGTSVRELVRSKRLSLDTLRVGMLGHSLGGAAALEACRSDGLFRACADMDGAPVGDVERQGVDRPMLVLLSQPGGPKREPKDSVERAHQEEFARMGRERDSTWRAIVTQHPSVPAYVVVLRGTAHMSFSDAPFLMPALMQHTGSTLSADRAYQLIVERLLAFFDHFVAGQPLRLLQGGVSQVE